MLFKSVKYTILLALRSTEKQWISFVGLNVGHVPSILQALMRWMQTVTPLMPCPGLKSKFLQVQSPCLMRKDLHEKEKHNEIKRLEYDVKVVFKK